MIYEGFLVSLLTKYFKKVLKGFNFFLSFLVFDTGILYPVSRTPYSVYRTQYPFWVNNAGSKKKFYKMEEDKKKRLLFFRSFF